MALLDDTSIASSKVAVAGRAAIAIRGIITSWTRRSPSSMTALIICSSSASRTPCSPPRSTISRSSSAVIWASLSRVAPNSPAIARVIPVRSRDQRAEGPGEELDRERQRDREALGVGEGERLGDELGEDDREQRER